MIIRCCKCGIVTDKKKVDREEYLLEIAKCNECGENEWKQTLYINLPLMIVVVLLMTAWHNDQWYGLIGFFVMGMMFNRQTIKYGDIYAIAKKCKTKLHWK